MRLTVLCAIAFIASSLPVCAEDVAYVRAADGFQLPVGPNGNGQGYYIARGYRPNGHLGEDWNGVGGGDTDLGDPVYAIANGYVTFARNYHVGWGNVVIIRHAYYEGSELKYCDSLYGHVLDFLVHEGDQVHRGQLIAHIGNNFGMYEAHLHLEMRKNLQIGMFRSSFLRDFSNYYSPNEFIAEHRACPHANTTVKIPINTYPPVAPPVIAGPHVESPMFGVPRAGSTSNFVHFTPLPPQGSSASATASGAPKIVTSVPAPAPSVVVHDYKYPTSQALASAVTPPPTPAVKTSRTSSAVAALIKASATPTPSAQQKHQKSTAAVATPAPEATSPKITLKDNHFEEASATPTPIAKHFKTGASAVSLASATSTAASPESAGISSKASAATGAATPTPTIAHAKPVASATVTPSPTDKSSKKAATSANLASTSPAATPAPATKHGKLAVTTTPSPAPDPAPRHSRNLASAATPSPKKGAKTPIPVAASPTPSPALAANKKGHKPASPTPEPQTTERESEVITANPILPPPGPTNASPITRNGSSFVVDPFRDMRGKGY